MTEERSPHSELVDDVREALLRIKQRTEGPDPYVNGLYRDAIDALASLEEQLEAVQRERDWWREQAVRGLEAGEVARLDYKALEASTLASEPEDDNASQ